MNPIVNLFFLASMLLVIQSPSFADPISKDNTLLVGQRLNANNYLESTNKNYRLYMQGDGNLVLRERPSMQAIWSSRTHRTGADYIIFQGDGNLVLKDNRGSVYWATDTHKKNADRFQILSSGSIVVMRGNEVLWSAGNPPVIDNTPPIITLKGGQEITHNQDEAFTDPGATATDNIDGDISQKIVVQGEVNTQRVGKYELNYHATDSSGNKASPVLRVVEVIRKFQVKNHLNLNESLYRNEFLESANKKYRLYMQGDGNLVLREMETKKAIWSSGTHTSGAIRISFQSDGNLVMRTASGAPVWSSRTEFDNANLARINDDGSFAIYSSGKEVWRVGNPPEPIPEDKPPVISLNGPSITSIDQFSDYIEPGYRAFDDLDGDLSSAVQVSGAVDSNTIGRYTLNYNVTDSGGNKAKQMSRIVDVRAKTEPPKEQVTKSTERFSSPSAALYALNDQTPRSPARYVNTGYGGNGHAETWDGRIFVRTRTAGWFVNAFRPERVSKNADGSPNFRGAFSSDLQLEHRNFNNGKPLAVAHNWIAIVPDPSHQGANPYPSNRNGDPNKSGSYATYKATIYHTVESQNAAGQITDGDRMVFRKATFIVGNPESRDATVVEAKFTSSFRFLVLNNGENLRCIEPSVTIDGRLIICQGHENNSGSIDRLVYSWNQESSTERGWSNPRNLSRMFFDHRNSDVSGMPFYIRYPLAENQLLDANGIPLQNGQELRGAYPWISRDGSELFYQHTRRRDGSASARPGARRSGTSVVGRWTGWALRHIDGPINRNRYQRSRLFLSSPGAFTTMWSAFKFLENPVLPYSIRGPGYPIFGSNSSDYSEVSFDDYLDGNYVMYLGMNEQLMTGDRNQDFIIDKTPDTSGHFNNGTLIGAKFPYEYNGQDILVGKHGQGIHFNNNDYIKVEKRSGWDLLNAGVTIDFFIKLESNSGSVSLFEIENGARIYLRDNRSIAASVQDIRGKQLNITGPVLANNQWIHIALILNKEQKNLSLHLNGVEQSSLPIDNFDELNSLGEVFIGPRNSQARLILDEVKLSNVARKAYELEYNAYRPSNSGSLNPSLEASIPSHLRSIKRHATNLDGHSAGAADIGKLLFSDPILSLNQKTSCATCHLPERAFTDDTPIAIGLEPTDNGTRNAPMLLNRLFSSFQGWGGNATDLFEQVVIPISAEHEMNLSINIATERLRANDFYRSKFMEVFGSQPSANTLFQAIASFEAVQFSPKTRFDDHLQGNRNVLNAQELRGLDLFQGKARCSGCHSGVNFTDESFRNNGLIDHNDVGRGGITGRDRDHKLFKVPSLRMVSKTFPYLHDGSVASLEELVDRYNEGPFHGAMLDTDIRPLQLTDQEKQDLVEFLKTL